MSVFGLTDDGFILKRLEDIKAEIEDDLRAAFGENVDLSADEPLGQIVSIVAERRADDWLALQAVYHSFWASQARGVSLARIGELRGVTWRGETYSTGFLKFTGTPGVEIPQGTRVQDAVGRQVETLATEYLNAVTGDVTVPARSMTAGPVTFAPFTTNFLVTSVFGVSQVTNTTEIAGGVAREAEEDFRARSNTALQNPGTSALEGIKNAVNNLPFIRDTIVVENSADTPDAEGRPGHSIEVLFLTNLTGTITSYPVEREKVALTIWNSKPGGIETVGDLYSVITDSQGFVHDVRYSEAEQLDVTISLTAQTNTDPIEGELFPLNGADLIREAVMAYGVSLNMGRDVWLNKIYSAASAIPGVKGVTNILINGQATNLSVEPYQLPIFSSGSIGVTIQ